MNGIILQNKFCKYITLWVTGSGDRRPIVYYRNLTKLNGSHTTSCSLAAWAKSMDTRGYGTPPTNSNHRLAPATGTNPYGDAPARTYHASSAANSTCPAYNAAGTWSQPPAAAKMEPQQEPFQTVFERPQSAPPSPPAPPYISLPREEDLTSLPQKVADKEKQVVNWIKRNSIKKEKSAREVREVFDSDSD